MIGISEDEPSLGGLLGREGVCFRVWAPDAATVELSIEGREGTVRLSPEPAGFHSISLADAGAGNRYRYLVDGAGPFPDPASRWQPEGVHGPSEVIDPEAYPWRSQSQRIVDPESTVIYELHIGTFTPEGTFTAARQKLPYLAALGVTALELMPLADFPGRWNWGYDPGSFFAPSRSYGTPDELRRFVDEAHGLGLHVLLDVIYNHFGPDGAYLPAFSPSALTSRHHTPWGPALDFDGERSLGLRRFCLENALMWLREYRFDGLRLDATFAIIDDGPLHILAELTQAVARLPGPQRLLIAEDPRNSRNVVLPVADGGLGMGAVWADDFHHQLRVRLAGDEAGYYRDFSGTSDDIARTLTGNWFYRGHHSRNQQRPRGTPAADLPARHFVYCIQNHDQVGNRPRGERLSSTVPLHSYRAATALLLFAPQLPLLFMGQEWAASSPFLFFTDHEGELGKAVSEGRRQEFADFSFSSGIPDPQDPETFRRSRLNWGELEREPHAGTLQLYRDLLSRRRTLTGAVEVEQVSEQGIALRRAGTFLLVAFEAGAFLALPPEARVCWSSESTDYDLRPEEPIIEDAGLRFPRAAAILAEANG